MINREKVELMSRASRIEKTNPELFRLERYFDPEYLKIGRLKNFFFAWAAFFVIFLLISTALVPEGSENYTMASPVAGTVIVVVSGAVFAVLYCVLAEIFRRKRYDDIKYEMREYRLVQAGLDRIYDTWNKDHEKAAGDQKQY